jgi:hypothetical protein
VTPEQGPAATPGAPVSTEGGATVKVGETEYTLVDAFPEADIPFGFTKTQLDYEGQARQMVKADNAEIYLGYLVNAEGKGDFFLYTADDATFSPFEEIQISEDYSIFPLSKAPKDNIPSKYQEVSLSLNGKEFPVWQDTEEDGFYLLYAVNSNGEKLFYQYDETEATYQRCSLPEIQKDTPAKKDTTPSWVKKIKSVLDKYLAFVVGGVGILFIIFLTILIVIGIKLRHRNSELDDLYDEYGIGEDDDDDYGKAVVKEATPTVHAKKAVTPVKQKKAEDDFESYDTSDLLDDADDIFTHKASDATVVYAKDDTLDDLLEQLPGKNTGHTEDDDTFKVDFIDLD